MDCSNSHEYTMHDMIPDTESTPSEDLSLAEVINVNQQLQEVYTYTMEAETPTETDEEEELDIDDLLFLYFQWSEPSHIK